MELEELAQGQTRNPRSSEGSWWNNKKDLSFVLLRPERVVEVRFDHMEGDRFRTRRSSSGGGLTATRARARSSSSRSR